MSATLTPTRTRFGIGIGPLIDKMAGEWRVIVDGTVAGSITRTVAAVTVSAGISQRSGNRGGSALAALRNWQACRLSGAGGDLPLLPYVVGLLVFVTFALRSGQGGFRLTAGGVDDGGPPDPATRAGLADRDDDRFWKGGLIYVNRDDPALMVGARFGVGWTFNLANRAAWLLLSAIAGVPAGLVIIAVLTR